MLSYRINCQLNATVNFKVISRTKLKNMNFLKKNTFLCNKLMRYKLEKFVYLKSHSTKPAIKEESTEDSIIEAIKTADRLTHLPPKKRTKKPQREPFVKNVFLGKFDKEVLTYPQLEKEELERLNASLESVKNFFNREDVKQTQALTTKFKEELINLKLFGLRAPHDLGGKDLNVTEASRIQEIISQHPSKRSLIYNEQFCIQALLKWGSDDLKSKYVPLLTTGTIKSAFAITEQHAGNPQDFKTTASRSADGTWVLNGEKTWVLNGDAADVFLVCARNTAPTKDDRLAPNLVAFIVEKKFGGVYTDRCKEANGEDIAHVVFKDTCVPHENVVGIENSGLLVLTSILTELRLSTGTGCITLSRKLLENFIDCCKELSNDQNKLLEAESVLFKIGEMAINLYATESITYLTSGLLDNYDKQDCEVEATIVKVFASEQSVKSALTCLDFIGAPAFINKHWANESYRDALAYTILNETNNSLKLVIALYGVQHAGKNMQEIVSISRNPFFHPFAALKRSWDRKRQYEDNPRLTLGLGEYLHPSCFSSAKLLEYCVLRLQFATEILLCRHGIEVINAHKDLERLAECAIDIYAMTACLGRASRSYCIGLQNGAHELLLANIFCIQATERVKRRVLDIYQGEILTGDANLKEISNETLRLGKYFAQHPLTRNY